MTFARRLMIMIAAGVLALCAVGAVGVWQLRALDASLRYAHENLLGSVENIADAKYRFMFMRTHLLALLMTQDMSRKEGAKDVLGEDAAAIATRLDAYAKVASDSKDRQLLTADRAAIADYLRVQDTMVQLSMDGEDDKAHMMLTGDGWESTERALVALDAHATYNQQLAERERARAATAAERGMVLMGGVIALAALGLLLWGVLLYRRMIGPLRTLREVVANMAASLDFTLRAPARGRDEVAQTVVAFNELVERIQHSLRAVADQSAGLARAASHLTGAAARVSEVSAAQSDASSSMAAAVQQMSVNIAHVGEQAGSANRLAEASGQEAGTGARVIGQTVGDIQDIAVSVQEAAERIRSFEESSLRIATVLGVIKEVADQTNLLALNAAIEAARAGEQGRGFAVVADEVRTLAERTALSTREISQTVEAMQNSADAAVASIERAVSQTQSGVTRAGNASGAIGRIDSGTRQVVAAVDEITHAIIEQGRASDAIASQIDKIASGADHALEAARQTSDTAHELDTLAGTLREVVSAYRL
ncbi:MAG: methyl-accepting chemotaxis protein [Rhodocyclaceae bacterium]